MQSDSGEDVILDSAISNDDSLKDLQPAFLFEQVHFDPTGENKTVCYRPAMMLLHFTQFELGVTCYDCLDIIDKQSLIPDNERRYISRNGEVFSGYPIRIE